MQRTRAQRLLIITLGLILLVIIVGLIIVIAGSGPQDTAPPIPTTAPSLITPSAKTNPPVIYAPTGTQKMLDKLVNRSPLSGSDRAAKEKIIALLPSGQVSGIIYKSPTFNFEYISSADEFQSEILTVDIAQAKTDTISWLSTQGLSKNGVCSLPVVFYLNRNIANQLRSSNIKFNPLAEGC